MKPDYTKSPVSTLVSEAKRKIALTNNLTLDKIDSGNEAFAIVEELARRLEPQGEGYQRWTIMVGGPRKDPEGQWMHRTDFICLLHELQALRREKAEPRIWIDDFMGRIKIAPGGVCADVLYRAWKANGEDVNVVAAWHGVTTEEVLLAIKCEEYVRPRVDLDASLTDKYHKEAKP